MGLPTLDKTWQFNVNLTCSIASRTAAAAILAIKNALIGFAESPWEVVSSCARTVCACSGACSPLPPGCTLSDQYAVAIGGDLWLGAEASSSCATNASLVWANAGSSHSWIVLQQPGLDGLQLLIDLDHQGAGATAHYNALIYVSPSVGFAGGTTTARPTASDEVRINPLSAQWTGFTTSVTWRYHVMQSDDGEVTYIFGAQANHVQNVWVLSKLKNPHAGLAYPIVAMCLGSGSGTTEMASHAKLYDIASATIWNGDFSGVAYFSTETANGDGIGQIQTTVDNIDSSWPLSPIGIVCTTPGLVGRYGQLYDMWFGSTGAANGDGYDDGGSKTLCQLRDLVVPSNGLTLATT